MTKHADIVLTRVGQTFPVGTSVGLYRVLMANSGVQQPGGEPVATAVVAENESLVFEEVVQDQPVFYAAARLGNEWRSIQATTSVGEPVTDVVPVTEAVEELEAGKADLTEPGGVLVESQLPSSVVSGSNEPVPTPGVTHVFNVKDGAFGAKGDGVADDTKAIQKAIDAATGLAGGGIVFLPAGTYELTETLVLKSHVELQGQGSLTVLAPAYAAGNSAAITNELTVGNENISLRSFRLTRAGANVQHGILLNGITNLDIEGLEIVGSPSVTSGALAISGILPGAEPVRKVSKNVRIRGCFFQDCNNFGVQVSWVTNCTIVGNLFDNCYREAIGVEPEAGCTVQNVTISGNVVTTGAYPGGGSETGAIILTGNSGGTIIGATVIGNTVEGIVVEAGKVIPGILVNGSLVSGVVVSSNTVTNLNGPGILIGTAGAAGVLSGAVVTNNTVRNCNKGENAEYQGAGLSLRNATHVLAESNYIEGAKHTASVYESNAAANNKVCNNFLRDTTKITLLESSGTVVFNNKEGADADASIVFGSNTTNTQIVGINTKAATFARLALRSVGLDRWFFQKGNGAETGENAGSDLELISRTDAGGSLLTVLTIIRKTGNLRHSGAQFRIDNEFTHLGTKSGVNGATPVVKAAAIASPAAELAALKTAVDALREAIKKHGITE